MRLYLIQISAFFAIWLSTYYPGLDLLLSLFFVIIIGHEAGLAKSFSRSRKLLLCLLWQGPAAFVSLAVISSLDFGILSSNGFFIIQFWVTPLMPLLSLLAGAVILSRPLYYYILLAVPFILSLYYYRFSEQKILPE